MFSTSQCIFFRCKVKTYCKASNVPCMGWCCAAFNRFSLAAAIWFSNRSISRSVNTAREMHLPYSVSRLFSFSFFLLNIFLPGANSTDGNVLLLSLLLCLAGCRSKPSFVTYLLNINRKIMAPLSLSPALALLTLSKPHQSKSCTSCKQSIPGSGSGNWSRISSASNRLKSKGFVKVSTSTLLVRGVAIWSWNGTSGLVVKPSGMGDSVIPNVLTRTCSNLSAVDTRWNDDPGYNAVMIQSKSQYKKSFMYKIWSKAARESVRACCKSLSLRIPEFRFMNSEQFLCVRHWACKLPRIRTRIRAIWVHNFCRKSGDAQFMLTGKNRRSRFSSTLVTLDIAFLDSHSRPKTSSRTWGSTWWTANFRVLIGTLQASWGFSSVISGSQC